MIWNRRARRSKGRYILAVVVGLIVLGAGALSTLSFGGWRTVAGYRTSDGDRVDFELRYRGTDAYLVEKRQGVVIRTATCVSGVFEETFSESSSAVRQQLAGADQCFHFATDAVLGFGSLRRSPELRPRGHTVVDGRAADVLAGLAGAEWSSLVLDHSTNLPLSAVSSAGMTIEWHYSAMDIAGDEPMTGAAASSAAREEYVDLPRAELAGALGVPSLPDSIEGLAYETGFSYVGGQMTKPRRYAIWSAADGRQIQIIIGFDPVVSSKPVIETDGGTLSLTVREGDVSLQIIATDASLLRAAVGRFRPSYESSIP